MLSYVMGQVHARAHAVHLAFVGIYDDDVGVGRVHGEISSYYLPSLRRDETRRNGEVPSRHATQLESRLARTAKVTDGDVIR